MDFNFLPFTQNLIRDQLKELREENKKLKGQLLDFVVRDDARRETDTDSSEDSSLYAMVQQYMMENQVLKNENNELKSQIDRLKSELAAKHQQKEDITQEVLRYLMNQNANTRGSNSYAQIYPKMEHHLIPPAGIPYSPQSLQMGHYMQRYPPDENIVYSPSFPRIESVDSSPNTPALFKRVPQKKSKIPKHIQERNREIDRLSRINRSAQSDIDEINKQIQMYKKLNRTQRLPR